MGQYDGWRDYKAAGTVPTIKPGKYYAVPHIVLPDLRVLPEGECAAVYGGLRFASKHEAVRYVALRQEQEAGVVTDLELQPVFTLHVLTPDGVKVQIGRYVSDFSYRRRGALVIEDAKGMKTPLYKRSKKHAEAEYGIRILET